MSNDMLILVFLLHLPRRNWKLIATVTRNGVTWKTMRQAFQIFLVSSKLVLLVRRLLKAAFLSRADFQCTEV